MLLAPPFSSGDRRVQAPTDGRVPDLAQKTSCGMGNGESRVLQPCCEARIASRRATWRGRLAELCSKSLGEADAAGLNCRQELEQVARRGTLHAPSWDGAAR